MVSLWFVPVKQIRLHCSKLFQIVILWHSSDAPPDVRWTRKDGPSARVRVISIQVHQQHSSARLTLLATALVLTPFTVYFNELSVCRTRSDYEKSASFDFVYSTNYFLLRISTLSGSEYDVLSYYLYM